MAIIGINGYAGSGKDTVGRIIQYLNCPNKGELTVEDVCLNSERYDWWLEDESMWEIQKFAGKLKDIASHLTGIDREKFEDQNFKKTYLSSDWDTDGNRMSVRDLLQKLGTECMRNGLHINTWVNALMADYKKIEYNDDEQAEYPDWIITDVRFENEAKAIKDRKGIIIRIDRPGVEPINAHPSETGLDQWKFDYKIANVSDIYALKESVEQILKHAKFL